MRHKRVVHLAAAGTRDDGAAWVPYCEQGYAAFKRGALAPVNTIPSEVTCEVCKKNIEQNRLTT